jgi:hypothetical protein
MSQKMKLCIDCKHYREVDGACLAEIKTSPVDGKQSYYFAKHNRYCLTSCGMSAVWFVPVKELVQDFDDVDPIFN